MTMTLYQKYLMMRNEILKHKWIESEKIHGDIGFDRALEEWVKLHHKKWAEYKNLDNWKQSS